MDGKEFFEKVQHAQLYGDRGDTLAEVTHASSDQLHGMLSALYGEGQIEFVPTDETPESIVLAHDFIDEDKRTQALARQYQQMQRKQLYASGNVRFQFKTRQGDESASLGTDTLTKLVDEALVKARNEIVHDSTLILARSVVQAHTQQPKIAIGKLSHAKIAYDNIAGHNRRFSEHVGSNAFHIDVVSDSKGKTIEVGAAPRKPMDNLPAWLSNREGWDNAVSTMIGHGMLEFDAYFALVAWCMDRRLPIIPVATPIGLESARLGEDYLNTNSDILLCNIETNDIVPIQVKNSTTAEKRNGYIPEMKFITPSLLGIQEIGQRIVKSKEGNTSLISVTTTHYGKLASEYMNRVERKGKTKKTADDPFQTAFRNFDAMFLS
jgi:hypothetical protein